MNVEIATICIDTLVDEIFGTARSNPGKEIKARDWASDRNLSPDEMKEFVIEVFDRVHGFTSGEVAAKDLSLRTIPESIPGQTSNVTDVAIKA